MDYSYRKKHATAARRAFVLDLLKQNPKISHSQVDKAVQEKFGVGMNLPTLQKLRKLKPDTVSDESEPDNPLQNVV